MERRRRDGKEGESKQRQRKRRSKQERREGRRKKDEGEEEEEDEEEEKEEEYLRSRGEEEELMVFFDVKKAFDRVNRSMICKEMLAKGVDLQWVKLINSSLKDTTLQARMNNMLGLVVESNTGVFQGSPISTVLFTCLYDRAYKDVEKALTKWKVNGDGLRQFKDEELEKVFPLKEKGDEKERGPRIEGKRMVKKDIRRSLDLYIKKHTEITLKRGAKFADDLVLKCLLNDINKLMTAVVRSCSDLGLEMSWKKQ